METSEPEVTQGTPEQPIATGTMDPVPGPEKPEVDADAEPGTPEPAKDTQSIDKQVGKSLRATLRQAERDAAYWRGVAEGTAGEKGPKDSPADAVPKQADFDDYEQYIVAKAEHAAQKASEKEHQKLIRVLDERDKRVSFQSRVESFRAEHPDFDEFAAADDLAVTPHMADIIKSLPTGVPLLYHLGQHKEEALRISRLPLERQAYEMGAWFARVSQPVAQPARAPSSAPAPINPLKGVSSTNQKDPAKQTDEEWWRDQKEMKRKR